MYDIFNCISINNQCKYIQILVKKLKNNSISETTLLILFYRIQLMLTLLILSTIGTDCELTESVIFHPLDHIQTNKNSWTFTKAINFTSYLRTLNRIFNYCSGVRETLVDFTKIFYREDLRCMKLLNMTMDDMTLALDEIMNMQTGASSLIGHIQNRNR